MKKEEPKIQECPKCGCKSFITTTKGPMCAQCKFVITDTFFILDGPKKIQ